jgi:hypothetical protein
MVISFWPRKISLMDLPDKDLKCHLTGFEKSCRTLVCDGHCKRWKPLEGIEDGAKFTRWDCIDNHAHTLQKITVFSIQSNSAAVESMRNKANEAHQEQKTMAAIAVQRSQDTIRQVFTSYVAPTDAIPYHENDDQKALPFA